MPSSEGQTAPNENAPGEQAPGDEQQSNENLPDEEAPPDDNSLSDENGPHADDVSPEQDSAAESVREKDAAGGTISDENSPVDSGSSAESRVVECANCGFEFEGNYCPKCGQEADPSVTIGEVFGSFARELADIEGGFRTTVVGLTISPATTLRDYLQGMRARLMSPGRYLLASVVISFVVMRAFAWLGVLLPPSTVAEQSAPSAEEEPALRGMLRTIGQVADSQWFYIALTLAGTGLLALVLLRVFSEELSSAAEALVTSAYLMGHATVLRTGLLLLLLPLISFSMERPVGLAVQGSIEVLVTVIYIGAVGYSLGRGWRSGVKASAAVVWAYVESIMLVDLGIFGYVVLSLRPGLSVEEMVEFAVVGVIFSLPLLLHAGVELYYRFR